VEKRFSHGLQLQASYTFGKSIDNASSFENLLNPLNPKANRSLSLFDARHRFVLNYFWELPIAKREGVAGKLLNGWSTSAIVAFQSGFPIRITEQDDIELENDFDFETPGEPDLLQPFKTQDVRTHNGFAFDGTQFAPPVLGTIGNSPRSVCCGPGLNNFDFGFQKNTQVGERTRLQFRADILNIFNHAHFFTPDGNFTDGPTDFGRVKRAGDPRLIQFALKIYF